MLCVHFLTCSSPRDVRCFPFRFSAHRYQSSVRYQAIKTPTSYAVETQVKTQPADQLFWDKFRGFLQTLQENSGILPRKKGVDHLHFISSSLHTHRLFLCCSQQLNKTILTRYQNVWYSTVKPSNDSPFNYTFPQISCNTDSEYSIVKQSNTRYFDSVLFYFLGATAQRGSEQPHSWSFWITHKDAPKSVGLLWTSDRPVAETSIRQYSTFTRDRYPCPIRIRTSNSRKRAATDPRLKLLRHWDRHSMSYMKPN